MGLEFKVNSRSQTRGPSPKNSAACGGLFFMVFALGFGGLGYLGLYQTWKDGEVVPMLITGLFALIGTGFFVLGIYSLTRKNRAFPHSGSGIFLDNVMGGLPLPQAVRPALTTQGYYVLKPKSSHKAQFFGMLFFALIWNGIIWTIIIATGDNSLFLYLFAAIGLLFVGMAVYSCVRWLMVGETRLESNRYPAAPGEALSVRLIQPGRFAIDELVMQLVCEERAEYRVGTDTKTRTEVVRTVDICHLTRLTARDTQALAYQAVQVPADAVLSFSSPNNQINWMVRVKMALPRRPDVTQDFLIPVMTDEIMNLIRPGGK